MQVVTAASGGSTPIDYNGFSNDYINVNDGILMYVGNQGVTDTFTVPIFVQGGGAFILTGLSSGQCGTLDVKNLSEYTFPNGSQVSVYMQDGNSTVQLNKSATLECDNSYYQDNGTLETMDLTTCTLNAPGQTVNISGGNVAPGGILTGLAGELDVGCTTLNLDYLAYYMPTIFASGNSSLLKVNGNMNIANTAELLINTYGDLEAGSKWTIITANNQLQSFQNTNEGELELHEKVTNSYVLSY